MKAKQLRTRINSEGPTAPAIGQPSSRLDRMFYGPLELRVGWRLLIFVVIVLALMFAKAAIIHTLPNSSDQAVNYLLNKTLKFTVFLLASRIMGRIEARTIADYGLPWR